MKRRILSILTLTPLLAAPAQAQTLEQTVGAWTRLQAIGLYCPKFYRVDVQYLNNLAAVFEEAGTKAFPGQIGEAEIRAAGARRDAEVKAMGAKKWCTKWRKAMRADGTGQIWP